MILFWRLLFYKTSVFSFLFFHLVVPEEINNEKCHLEYPSNGFWLDKTPYWQPNITGCPVYSPFDLNSTQKCLKGRTIYVMGNSIQRQLLFGVLEMLGGLEVDRTGQKLQCPKLAVNWGDTCRSEFRGINLRYLYLQWMDGWDYGTRGGFSFIKEPYKQRFKNLNNSNQILKLAKEKIIYHEDGCLGSDIKRCLQSFFSNATSYDVLIFGMGFPYANLPRVTGHISPTKVIDQLAWAYNAALAFRENINVIFPQNGSIFRQTLSPLNNAESYQQHYNTRVMTENNLRMESMLSKTWGSQQKRIWYTIDQMAINKGREHMYVDHIHFPGMLTFAALHIILNTLCPSASRHPKHTLTKH